MVRGSFQRYQKVAKDTVSILPVKQGSIVRAGPLSGPSV